MQGLIFILGLLFGSFYLVIALRLPKGEDILVTRSHCDNCKTVLKWYELIPVVSYVIQKGKCNNCHEKISILNPIVELSCAILFLIGFHLYGISLNYFEYLIIVSLMIIILVSDFKYMIINDSPLVISLILILIIKYLIGGINLLAISLVSGIVLFLMMYLVSILGKLMFKRESLGGADIKLSFIIGVCVGFRLGLCVLILSVFLALPYAIASLYLSKNNEVAYGPFLIGALLIVFIFSAKFLNLLAFIGA